MFICEPLSKRAIEWQLREIKQLSGCALSSTPPPPPTPFLSLSRSRVHVCLCSHWIGFHAIIYHNCEFHHNSTRYVHLKVIHIILKLNKVLIILEVHNIRQRVDHFYCCGFMLHYRIALKSLITYLNGLFNYSGLIKYHYPVSQVLCNRDIY